MNRRHDLVDKHIRKKAQKEIRKGMKQETFIPKKTSSAKKISKILSSSSKPAKKVSKRTSPKEKIENSTPAYPHKEGSKWIANSRKKMLNAKKVYKNK